jgi:uncharacterized protein YdcH (DUF465 family)
LANNLEPSNTIFLDIINKIPYLDNFLIDLDYFDRNGLINSFGANPSSIAYDNLFNLILNDLRKENVKFQSIFRKKDFIEHNIASIENKIEIAAELMVKATGQARIDYDKEIDDLFYFGIQPEKNTAIAAYSSIEYEPTPAQWMYGSFIIDDDGFSFPVNFTATISGTTYPLTASSDSAELIITNLNNRTRLTFEVAINNSTIDKNSIVLFDTLKQESSTMSNT